MERRSPPLPALKLSCAAYTELINQPVARLANQRDRIAIVFALGFVRVCCGEPGSEALATSVFRAGRPGRPIKEVKLAASPKAGDHRRRILDHQEKVEAQRRAPPTAPQSSEPQLRIPLIGEVRRPEPAASKPKRPRGKKPVQPDLGEF
jgi:hypothetical protein